MKPSLLLWIYVRGMLIHPILQCSVAALAVSAGIACCSSFVGFVLGTTIAFVVCQFVCLLPLIDPEVRASIRVDAEIDRYITPSIQQRIAQEQEQPVDDLADWDERFEESLKEERFRVG